MSKHTILIRRWKNRIASTPFSKFAFLAGAGISVESGLPTAWAFNKSLARFLGASQQDREQLQNLLTTGYAASQTAHVRFEQVVQILRDFDSALSILRIFDETGGPTFFHSFLAHALSRGAAVFTTNFDSLIERAYYKTAKGRRKSLNQVIYEDDVYENGRRYCVSFEKLRKFGCAKPALLKLHGSLRLLHRATEIALPESTLDGLASIGATLDKLGRTSGDLRLEPNKEAVLEECLHRRIVCIIGYSGGDDFDITASLAQALKHSSGVIWVRHEAHVTRIFPGNSRRALSCLPPGLRSVCAHLDSVVISGYSAQIIQELFGISPSPKELSVFNIRPVDTVLSGYEPYANMPQLTKDLIHARIASQAADWTKAKRLYGRVFRGSSHNRPHQAEALFQLGVIARIQCRHSQALQYLQSANRHADDTRLKRRILNVTGNVHLDKGELSLAVRYYKRALEGLKKSEDAVFRSTIFNNLGLVERKRSHFRRALQYHKQALLLSSKYRDRTAMARDHGNIGTVYLRLKQYPAALGSYTKAVGLARMVNAKETLATTLMNRALVLKHLKRYGEAERLAHKAMQLEDEMKRTQGIARYYSLVGGLAHEQRKYSKAVRMLRVAIKMQVPLKRLEGLADDWFALGESLREMKKVKEAKRAYESSRACFRAFGNGKGVAAAAGRLKSL